jgi:hypothetical protein
MYSLGGLNITSNFDVKLRGLDLTLLLNSALKFLTLPWQIAVCSPQIATTKMAVLLIAKARSLNFRADYLQPEPSTGFLLGLRAGDGSTFESWLPSSYSCCGKPWNWSTVVSIKVKSSPRYFTSRDSQFASSLKRDFTSLQLIR